MHLDGVPNAKSLLRLRVAGGVVLNEFHNASLVYGPAPSRVLHVVPQKTEWLPSFVEYVMSNVRCVLQQKIPFWVIPLRLP